MIANQQHRYLLPLLLIFGLVLWGCSSDDDGSTPVGPEPPQDLTANCVGCHTNDALLQATAIPDETPPGDPSGEG